MTQGVIYLAVGTKIAERLVVSINSLKKYYNGDITLLCLKDHPSYQFYKKVVSDERIKANIISFEKPPVRRNACYLTKTLVHLYTPYDRTVFIDADTLIKGDINEVFPKEDELVLTQFSNWTMLGNKMSGRVASWGNKVDPELTKDSIKIDRPAINTGIFGFTKNHLLFKEWYELTKKRCCFMVDELSIHLLFHRYNHRVLDDRYNYSLVHSKRNKNEAVIIHFHGQKHVTKLAAPIWFPEYQECFDKNIGFIKEWSPSNDRRLKKYLREVANAGKNQKSLGMVNTSL